MILRWRKVYETGINSIDEQHQILFNILKKIYEAPIYKKSEKLEESVQELLNYADYHFKNEEEYMKEINFPAEKLEHHKDEHGKYLIEINKLLENNISKHILLPMNTTEFLKDWLIDHILGEDQEFKEWADK
ncbi:MAG: bacteriohemerythrin [bacterium]